MAASDNHNGAGIDPRDSDEEFEPGVHWRLMRREGDEPDEDDEMVFCHRQMSRIKEVKQLLASEGADGDYYIDG